MDAQMGEATRYGISGGVSPYWMYAWNGRLAACVLRPVCGAVVGRDSCDTYNLPEMVLQNRSVDAFAGFHAW